MKNIVTSSIQYLRWEVKRVEESEDASFVAHIMDDKGFRMKVWFDATHHNLYVGKTISNRIGQSVLDLDPDIRNKLQTLFERYRGEED
jgi:hypothetical protein